MGEERGLKAHSKTQICGTPYDLGTLWCPAEGDRQLSKSEGREPKGCLN